MKVLVLSGRFGMGHEMAANAICEQFRKLDKDTEIVKKDLLEELYPHISKLIFGGFRLMVEHCHGIYNFIYKMSGKMKVEMQPRGAAIYKKLKKILEKEQPDVIVCTHPMCVKAIASYKEKTGLSTPLVTCLFLHQIILYMTTALLPFPGAEGISEFSFVKLFTGMFSSVPVAAVVLVNRGISFYFLLILSGILGVVLGRFNGRSADQSGTKYKLQQETENGTGKILT